MHAPACAVLELEWIGSGQTDSICSRDGHMQLRQARCQASHCRRGCTRLLLAVVYWWWCPAGGGRSSPLRACTLLPRPHAARSIAREIIEQFVTCHSPTAQIEHKGRERRRVVRECVCFAGCHMHPWRPDGDFEQAYAVVSIPWSSPRQGTADLQQRSWPVKT
jgi:hypothetical protein